MEIYHLCSCKLAKLKIKNKQKEKEKYKQQWNLGESGFSQSKMYDSLKLDQK